jgi:hypothetical protein
VRLDRDVQEVPHRGGHHLPIMPGNAAVVQAHRHDAAFIARWAYRVVQLSERRLTSQPLDLRQMEWTCGSNSHTQGKAPQKLASEFPLKHRLSLHGCPIAMLCAHNKCELSLQRGAATHWTIMPACQATLAC